MTGGLFDQPPDDPIDGSRRHEIAEERGYTDRKRTDRMTGREIHRIGAAAEKLVCDTLGVEFSGFDSIYDGGVDFWMPDERTGDVKWSSWTGPDVYLKNSDDNHAGRRKPWCDLYVLVTGPMGNFRIRGYATGEALRTAPERNFGKQGWAHAIVAADLEPFDDLIRQARRPSQ